MLNSDDSIRKANEANRWREMTLQEYGIGLGRSIGQDENTGGPVGKTVPAAPSANLAIVKPENFSFLEIEKFLFKRDVPGKSTALEKQNPFQEVLPKDGAGDVVQSTASQFNDVNGASTVFASNGAPESLSAQSGEVRLLAQENSLRSRPLMV